MTGWHNMFENTWFSIKYHTSVINIVVELLRSCTCENRGIISRFHINVVCLSHSRLRKYTLVEIESAKLQFIYLSVYHL